ncbi:amino acid transporter AVT3B [Tetranychus urticae]|uniref:Amino acid transporter transmembrane domain-containing protein n=1 Tax=Tetranychus urticae TaxID=32264 RepID=T1KID8_TETUR|nr:amino acid transporter AVT3B [Tetranychus urticae]
MDFSPQKLNVHFRKQESRAKIGFQPNHLDKSEPEKKGLSVLTTILFVAGENAGVGILALPYALNATGWFGIPLMVMICIDSTIAASLIGSCWLILEERWPEYREVCRNPYPEIGRRAFGEKMKFFVNCCLQIGSIGSPVVMLLVCSQLASDLIDPNRHLSYGLWIAIIAATICPLMWLGTPVEFWGAAALALFTSTVAVILLLTDMVSDYMALEKPPNVSTPSLNSISLAFGTLIFAYGGTAPFPTYQNDMQRKDKWPQAVILGFLILFLLFTPFSIIGYLAYGSSVDNNIVHSVPGGIKRDIVTILMAGHLFFAFILMINPGVQLIENQLKIDRSFNWKRVVIRFLMLCLVVFIGESVPRFGKVMDLLGGSVMTFLAYIFPPLFYVKLCSMKSPSWPQRNISLFFKLYCYKIILLGLIGGICATVSAMVAILGPNTFVLPCYIDFNCSYN